MMETASVLRLHRQQVAQLTAYCTTYRSYLWQSLIPTPERNQTLRGIQALQGRLEQAKTQGLDDIALSLSGEEKSTIKQLLSGITQLYGTMPSSERRARQLGEVSALRRVIEQTLRRTNAQAL